MQSTSHRIFDSDLRDVKLMVYPSSDHGILVYILGTTAVFSWGHRGERRTGWTRPQGSTIFNIKNPTRAGTIEDTAQISKSRR